MNKSIEKWKLKDLKPHPKQAKFFDDLPFHLLRDLADDMEARGQKELLEIFCTFPDLIATKPPVV